jgi:3D (Asp-Asp-Asp) domain-containing protein
MLREECIQVIKPELNCRLRLPVYLAMVAAITGCLVWASIAGARQEIEIRVDGKVVRHKTLQRTVGPALSEAGIELGPKDQTSPGPDAVVSNGQIVTVERAFPVRLIADGKEATVLTAPVSVQDLLRTAALALGEKDRVNLPLQDTVYPGCEIKVTRVQEKTVKEQFAVPAPTERRDDSSLLRGQQNLLREGTPGEGERLIKVVCEDGKEVSRETILERVVRPPVSRIVAYGTGSTVSRGGNVLRFRRAFDARATAYSHNAGSYTATGHRVRSGVVAVDPRVVPLGSRLYIDGYGYGTALDVGGAIKGDRIDLFFPSEAECRRWGVRWVRVYILE